MQIYRLCYKLTKVFSFIRCSLVVGGVSKVPSMHFVLGVG